MDIRYDVSEISFSEAISPGQSLLEESGEGAGGTTSALEGTTNR